MRASGRGDGDGVKRRGERNAHAVRCYALPPMTFNLRFSWLSLTLAACGVASGCAPYSPPLPSDVTVAPDGPGYCCPAGIAGCGCSSLGGHVDAPDQCASVGRECDAPADLWQPATDAHGCRFYTIARWTGATPLCFPGRPDVGTTFRIDAAFDDAPIDDAPIEDAPIADAPRADANLDVGVLPANVTFAPDGVGFCCAPDMPGCGCQSFGGHAETVSGCDASPHLCDVHPDDWSPVTDAHGCNFYSPPPIHVPGRSCFTDAHVIAVDAGPG